MNAFWDRTFNHDVDITTKKNRRKPFTRVSDVRAAFAWFLESPALREKRAGEPRGADPRRPLGQGSVRRQRFGGNPPGFGRPRREERMLAPIPRSRSPLQNI